MKILLNSFAKSFLLLMVASLSTMSVAALEASVDRYTLTDGDSLLLTVRNTESGTPDFSVLQKDFIISDQKTSQFSNSFNGKRTAYIQWQFTLSPIKSGNVSIPALHANGQSTNVIDLRVLPLSEAAKAQLKDSYFFDVQASTEQAIIGQEVIISMKIYAQSKIGGSITIPQINDKELEPLSDMTQSQRSHNGKTYFTHEQQFRVVAQDVGHLTISPFALDGKIQISYNRQKSFRIQSDPLTITVKDIPAEFPDSYPLLIAKDLKLTWLFDIPSQPHQSTDTDAIPEIDAGESINLMFEISANGIQSERIPDFKRLLQTQGFKQYPDNSQFNNTALSNQRSETIGLVATGENPAMVKGFKFPWWDIDSETVQWAELPSHEFSVKVPKHLTQNPVTSGLNEDDFTLAVDEAVKKALAEAPSVQSTENSSIWKYISIAAITAWLLTVAGLIWVVKTKSSSKKSSKKINEHTWQTRFKQGQKEANTQKIRQALLQWASLESGRTVISLHQVSAMINDTDIQQSLEHMINHGFEGIDTTALNTLYEYLNQVQTVVSDIPEVIIK